MHGSSWSGMRVRLRVEVASRNFSLPQAAFCVFDARYQEFIFHYLLSYGSCSITIMYMESVSGLEGVTTRGVDARTLALWELIMQTWGSIGTMRSHLQCVLRKDTVCLW